MLKRITGEEFDDLLAHYQASAFRLEQQPRYRVPYEAGYLDAFLAGNPIPPAQMAGQSEWLDNLRRNTAAGRIMSRVRVHDDPPTDYQRWLRSEDHHSLDAGERIRYAARTDAVAAGLVASQGDWWLLDGSRVIHMEYDDSGTPVVKTLTDAPDRVAEAIRWRDVAMRISKPAR